MILAGALLLVQAQDIQTPAPLSVGQWITQDDYPSAALRQNEEGAVTFDLTVDAEGRVSRCVIVDSSKSAILDETTCRVITRRARFRPMQDASGKPTPTQFRSRVRWQLPKPDPGPMPVEPRQKSTRMLVSADGAVKTCRATGSSPRPESDTMCQQFLESGLPPALAPLAILAKADVPMVIIASSGAEFDEAAVASMGPEPNATTRHSLAIATFDIGADGLVSRCVETVRAGIIGLPDNLCKGLPQRFATSIPHKGRFWIKVSTSAPSPEDQP